MSGIENYRTAEEIAAQKADEARIRAVLRKALDDGAALMAAGGLDEDPEVVELWVDRLWDGLRNNLDEEDRLHAIAILLTTEMHHMARRLMRIEAQPW